MPVIYWRARCAIGADLSRYRRGLLRDLRLVDRISATLPPVADEPERVIRCSRENAERAVCRALALAAVRREAWRVQMLEDEG